ILHGGIVDAATAPPAATTLTAASPARSVVTFTIGLSRRARVTLDVFDLEGRRLARLHDDRAFAPGTHATRWSGLDARGRAVGSGIVFARLVADGAVRTCRVV